MNTFKYITGMLFCLLLITGCKKDTTAPYKCTTCVTTPDAVAAHDASSKGIYKGIVIGSTGTVVPLLNGITSTLTSTINWTAGQPYVGVFAGTFNGSPASINFSVGLSGGTPTVTSSNIPGHPNTVFNIIKETSTSLVECFEGRFTGTASGGTLNLMLSRAVNAWGGTAKSSSLNSSPSSIRGTINGTTLNCNCQTGTSVSATVGADEITNGTFNDGSQTGTWSARRTL